MPLRVTSSGLVTGMVRLDDDDSPTAVATLRYATLSVEKQLRHLRDVKIDLFEIGDDLLMTKVEIEADERRVVPFYVTREGSLIVSVSSDLILNILHL